MYPCLGTFTKQTSLKEQNDIDNARNTTKMYQYEKLVECFKSKGCHLLVSKQDFEANHQSNKIPKLKYVASCGHEHEVHVNVFRSRDTGIVCPSCKSKENAIKKRGEATRTSEGQSLNILQEDICVRYLKETIKSFKCVKTNDGCQADLAMQPINANNDEWMRVQIKSTQRTNNGYSFHCHHNDYVGMLIICVSSTDKRMWFFNGSTTNLSKISIGKNKSKYDEHEVSIEHLEVCLDGYYNKLPRTSLAEVMVPLSACHKLAHEFRLHREKTLEFLDFEQPNESNLVYDFKVNGKRVQEAVCTRIRHKKGVIVHLAKNGGKYNTETSMQHLRICFESGDNDLYWLHMPDKRYFYCIKEDFLMQQGHITAREEPFAGKKNIWISCNEEMKPNKNGWDKYLFDYTNIDKERLTQLLQ